MNATLFQRKPNGPCRLDMRGICPQLEPVRSADDWTDSRIAASEGEVRLGDCFQVTEGRADRFEFRGDLSDCSHVGGGMQTGSLEVYSDVGDWLADQMSGGRLTVHGSANLCAGSGLHGGVVEVTGDVGEYAAGSSPERSVGMRGGTLVVRGSCDRWLGYRMRRGMVIIEQDVAPGAATRMIAGTIALCGHIHHPFAYGIQRGTVILLGEAAAEVDEQVPGFTAGEPTELSFIPMLVVELKKYLPAVLLSSQHPTLVMRSLGDRAAGGYGELIWFPQDKVAPIGLTPS